MNTEEITEKVKRIIKTHLGNEYSVRLFGSRANGTHRPGSDCDYMIEGPEKVPLEKLIAIRQESAKLPTLLKIDIVDQKNYEKISENKEV